MAPTGSAAISTMACVSRGGRSSSRASANTVSGCSTSLSAVIARLSRQPLRTPNSASPMPSAISDSGTAAWLISVSVCPITAGSVQSV